MKNHRITIEEIASEAHVSIATVSRIINNKGNVKESTRNHVLSIMEQHDFRPSKMGSPSPSICGKIILVCVPDFSNLFTSAVIEGIQKAAHENDYDVLCLQSKDYYTDYSDYASILETKSVSGILILSSVAQTTLIDELGFRCPVVMCCEFAENYNLSYISIDDYTSSVTAVRYLISIGCKKIGLINSSLKFKYGRHREKGYFAALEEAGLDTNSLWVSHISSVNYSLAYSEALHMLQLADRPDAIYACSDVFGIAAINAAKKLGLRIPEDLSVIGFDNIEISLMSDPPLTTIDQPKFQMGYQACELLIDKIRSPGLANKQVLLDTELIVRGSTRLPGSYK